MSTENIPLTFLNAETTGFVLWNSWDNWHLLTLYQKHWLGSSPPSPARLYSAVATEVITEAAHSSTKSLDQTVFGNYAGCYARVDSVVERLCLLFFIVQLADLLDYIACGFLMSSAIGLAGEIRSDPASCAEFRVFRTVHFFASLSASQFPGIPLGPESKSQTFRLQWRVSLRFLWS